MCPCFSLIGVNKNDIKIFSGKIFAFINCKMGGYISAIAYVKLYRKLLDQEDVFSSQRITKKTF